MGLADAWVLYETAVLSSSKMRSQVTEYGRWKNYIAPVFAEKAIDSVTNFDLLILRRDLERRNLSPQTVYHCLSLLRRVLRKFAEWTRHEKCLPSFKGVMPQFDNTRTRFLNHDELHLILDILAEEKSKNWYEIVSFAVNTGLRRSEIFNLRLNDVNFNTGIVAVMDTKSNKNRNIQLNDVAFDIAVKKKRILSTGNDHLFEDKSPRIFRNAVKDSGLNDEITDLRHKVVFHTLRHTFASWLVQSGYPIAMVSQMLGHSSINVTMRYAHLAPSQAREAVNLISRIFKYGGNTI